MTLRKPPSRGLTAPRSLLNRLVEMPDLARTIQALSAQTFAALVQKIGVEDAGELVALATTEQLVQVFDEDLFTSDRAGEREVFDPRRFAVWLEVLLEAGDEVAARRIAELDEGFVAHALSSIVLVLGEDALRQRMDDIEEDEARQVDKALESALSEELDGYILIAKQHDGWDAALSLILALDRDDRALLERLLDRLAKFGDGYLDDREKLSAVLTEAESLAEDVEAAREERRSQKGYVEPRAARGFLELARRPLSREERASLTRDPLTGAYFRDLERTRKAAGASTYRDGGTPVRALPPWVQRELAEASRPEPSGLSISTPPTTRSATGSLVDALHALRETDPEIFSQRMEELVYLTNVLLAGEERDGARMNPKAAADAVLAIVGFGVALELRARRPSRGRRVLPTREQLAEILRQRPADILFREASSVLKAGAAPEVAKALHPSPRAGVAPARSDRA
jgi:hypothetical protein